MSEVVAEIVTKRCKDCGNDYPATTEWFYRNGKYLGSYCKTCSKVHVKIWGNKNRDKVHASKKHSRELNLEKARARSKRWYENNIERSKVNTRRWSLANPEKVKEYQKRWQLNNPEKVKAHNTNPLKNKSKKVKESIKKWKKCNPEKVRFYHINRRTRKKSLPHAPIDLDYMLLYFDSICAYCGCELERYHLDHFIPLSDPTCPGTIPTNMVLACPSCNYEKVDSDPVEWVTRKFGEDQATKILDRIQAYFSSIDDLNSISSLT